MKQWVKKLLNQFEDEAPTAGSINTEHKTSIQDIHTIKPTQQSPAELTEDRATLLYFIDLYSKNLIEIDSRPVRKVREVFDEFSKGLLKPNGPNTEKILFRFRQFISSYRIQEYTYLQRTFEDFKTIIWDFADQLNESIRNEQARDSAVRESLEDLREAVEANSIDELKKKSREFIDYYIEIQNKTDETRAARLESVKRSLDSVKKKLVEVNQSARKDHLTGAANRKAFEEYLAKNLEKLKSQKIPIGLVAIDIDYFKKINDIFGHDAGDQVLKELVQTMKAYFTGPEDLIVRMGGEEFVVLCPGLSLPDLTQKAQTLLDLVRQNVIIYSDTQIRLTISAGIALMGKDEKIEKWLKRADLALYNSKNTGRDKYTIAPSSDPIERVA